VPYPLGGHPADLSAADIVAWPRSCSHTGRIYPGASAILGSIVNGQLTVQPRIPAAPSASCPRFRSRVIDGATTGSLGSQATAVGGRSGPAIQQIIDKMVTGA
jgi:hypothetical protein